MKYPGWLNRGLLWWAGTLASVLCTAAQAQQPLRFCADPDNLPFSKAEGPDPGLYVELAELVADKLGRPIEWVWWYTHNQRRALRNTVLSNACDVVVALPADYRARALAKSQPFLRVGHAVVSAPGFVFKGLDDLRGKRLGVQFGSTPQILVNTVEGLRGTTYKEQDEVFAALAKGEIDAAILWGPSAGWENKTRHGGRWQVTPVSGHDLSGDIGMAVRRDDQTLLVRINEALAALKPQIAQRAEKYGFPSARPIELAWASAAVVVPTAFVVRAADGPDVATAGRTRFNSQCSHCHGTNAVSPLRERDLRRLKMRYDAQWLEVAQTTITNGRPDKGMPTWKEVLKESEIQEVLAFLRTIQN